MTAAPWLAIGNVERRRHPSLARETTVALRGGQRAVLRPLTPVDRPAYLAGFARVGPEARYMRFFGPKVALTDREIRYFTNVDHHDHEAIVAMVGRQGVGVARFVRRPDDGTVADLAITVADAWRRRGIGSALLRRLGDRAAEEGLRRLHASVLWANQPMRATLRSLGAPARTTSWSDGVLEMDMDLPVRSHRSVHHQAPAPSRGLPVGPFDRRQATSPRRRQAARGH